MVLKSKSHILARSSLLSGPAIVSTTFVTDGTWPAGLQLAHSLALKPLGAWRKHMGRISWHHPDSQKSPGMSMFYCTCHNSLKLLHDQLFHVFFHTKTNQIPFLFVLSVQWDWWPMAVGSMELKKSRTKIWTHLFGEKHLHHWTKITKISYKMLMITNRCFCHQ